MTVVVATSNQHKIFELKRIFESRQFDIEFVSLRDLELDVVVDETGTTFEENAFIKAQLIHRLTGLPTIADDSGLEVDVLGGEPGIYSSRYAGIDANDVDNRHKLINQLNDLSLKSTPAAFRCSICYVDSLRTIIVEGSSHGTVRSYESGDGGFGYDPMFFPIGFDTSFAEMAGVAKDLHSHRGRAVNQLVDYLRALDTENTEVFVPDPIPLRDGLTLACIAAVLGETDRLRSTIRLMVRSIDDINYLYEALLQTYLFAGYPIALESLTVLNEEALLLGYLPERLTEKINVVSYTERGWILASNIYEGVFEKMMERLTRITPDLADWMIVEGYGKTLSRPGLDVITREICIVAVLSVLERDSQLISHVRGALKVGATREMLLACADDVTEWTGDQRGLRLRNIINQFS